MCRAPAGISDATEFFRGPGTERNASTFKMQRNNMDKWNGAVAFLSVVLRNHWGQGRWLLVATWSWGSHECFTFGVQSITRSLSFEGLHPDHLRGAVLRHVRATGEAHILRQELQHQ